MYIEKNLDNNKKKLLYLKKCLAGFECLPGISYFHILLRQ